MIGTPSFWQQKYSLVSWLLIPISWLYSLGSMLKRLFSGTYRSRLMVISVGNINVGGTGKTPICIEVAKILQNAGINFAFLTRGYKGTSTAVSLVNPNEHTAEEVGDEALMLAGVGDTYVFKNKVEGVAAIEASGKDYQVIIMDDGLQSYSIVKDFNILVLDGAYGLGNNRLLPAGPLRQHLNNLHENIDQVVINGFDIHALYTNFHDDTHIFNSYIRVDKKKNLKKDKNILAFAGIGRPDKFFTTLTEDLDYNLVEKLPFPDHYNYKPEELDTMVTFATQNKLHILTTEKDWQRLPMDYRKKIDYLKIHLEFDAPKEFAQNILLAVRKFNNAE